MPLVLLLVFGLGLFGQQFSPTSIFRSSVALVKVDVEAAGRDGRTISNLTQQDFLVFDEEQPQSIAHFGHESEQLDLLLLLDVSDSMSSSLRALARGAGRALSQLHPGDRVGLMLFARSARVFQGFTTDFGAARRVIGDSYKQSMGIGTVINDSLLAAADYVRRQPIRGRRAVVVFTDNEGTNYKSPDEGVVQAMYAADAVLHALVVRKRNRTPPRPSGELQNPGYTPADVRKVSERTGGSAVEGPGNVSEMFRQTIERIRSSYFIQYVAPTVNSAGFRRVRVELSPSAQRRYPDAVIHVRAGYYATP